MHSPTRRAFLEKLSILAAGGIAAANVPNALARTDSVPTILFPAAPRDRISIASYPFRAYIESPANRDRDSSLPGMNLFEFPAHVVATFKIHNIEPHSRHFTSTQPDYLDEFRKILQKTKVRVVNIAVGATKSFYDMDADARYDAVAYAKKWVDVAGRIGSPGIRAHIATARNSSPNVERTAESLRQVAEYAAGKNVVVTLENDDLVSEDAFFLVKTIEAVNHPYLRALPDFANSMLSGDADFNYRALQAMFQHAYNICHVKDGETNDDAKLFSVDLQKSFDILRGSGFRGYCSMEFDAPGEPYGPTSKLIEQTIKFLS
ncbi:MAG TPA: sugar phosphate isomerase/epimerase family protein [Candidatus Acidoferrum sp.]|nr:sugar phosphate isomerase/epimerase family protein [Candidatus Acidoferrum sp.]